MIKAPQKGAFFLLREQIHQLTQSVIQTTVGRKNLGDTHFMIPRFFAFGSTTRLRFALTSC